MKIPSHVLCEELNGEIVLLDIQSGRYFGLPGIASLFWKHLAQGHSFEQARDALLQEHDVEHAVLDRDLRALLNELRERELIEDAG